MRKKPLKSQPESFSRIQNILPFVENFVKKINFSSKKNSSEVDNEAITKYINKIFEQQERERIVRWLVNSIRESLDLDTVLNTIVEEIGKLLKVDRCLIALYEKEKDCFYFRSEYRQDDSIVSLMNNGSSVCELPYKWFYLLVKNSTPIIVNNSEKDKLEKEQREYLRKNNIKSLIMIPVIHKEDFLGMITVHQVNYQRKWENTHFEILRDTGNQIAVAIGQAILYCKIQKATRLKSEFLAGMSHELRTPLNAIIGFAQMLLCDDFGPINNKQRKFLNNVLVSGEHLLRLVNDLLDLTKIESGNMEVNYEAFEIYTEILETVSILKGLAIRKNINIKTNIDSDLCICADLRMFKQIMYNLLSNAIKFSDEAGEVTVKAFREKNNIQVEVYDNGIGISPRDRDKIFKSFSQLDSSLTRQQEGTGLGLTLTKKFIQLHNGEIDFESEKNNGSKFWFTLPITKQEK